MRHLLLAVNCLDLIERVETRRQTSVYAENFVVDDGCQGQEVEYLCTVPPNVHRAVFAEALVVESIHLSYLSAFVVASDQCDPVLVADFESQK